MPPTLAVAAMGRVNDVKAIVTKDFKRAGNRLLLLGRYDAECSGGHGLCRLLRAARGSLV